MSDNLLKLKVHTKTTDKSTGILQAGNRRVTCALGHSGITARKREGDGATPAGSWPFRTLFYRKDRVDLPAIQLQTSEISAYDGWCDDPECPEYNQLVSLPFSGSHENMWRDDHLYDLVVPLGYNDAPPVAGLGSAIFFHLAHDDSADAQHNDSCR